MKPHSPVPASNRIDAVDVARGFALLGILCVNVQFFSEPFGEYMNFAPTGPLADQLVHVGVHVLCTGKFYSLFSLLFGVGFALQRTRVRDAAAVSWGPLYARRLVFLLAVGAIHALGFWYGDILFLYATLGFVLLLLGHLPARTLAIVGAALLAFSLFLNTTFALLSTLSPRPQRTASVEVAPPAPAEPAPAEPASTDSASANPDAAAPTSTELASPAPAKPPFERLLHAWRQGQGQSPDDPVWMQAETEAYRDGPYDQLFAFRALSWGFILLISLFGFGWSVLGMFLIGAALAKGNAFAPQHRALHRRLVAAGFLVGLPVAALGMWVISSGDQLWRLAVFTFTQGLSGPLMAGGFLGMWVLIVASGKLRLLTALLANAGRMAFTNYLMQTLIATTTFYFYGLGNFGSFSRVEQIVFVFSVYLFQLVFSTLWMHFFQIGPLEYLWRTATYLRAPRLTRA
ncbi:MAG: DUF418 domain-containing protein [Planctomycetota bacterium]|nr:DUF418 domain-containing protein [Planctomycetota bacterium]